MTPEFEKMFLDKKPQEKPKVEERPCFLTREEAEKKLDKMTKGQDDENNT